MTTTGDEVETQARQKLEKVVIRFAGDSGDGMQLTGDRFTSEAALFGNDLATQPNYPAEIRAPAGTLPGVSSFQIQIADYDILTAGDRPDVLVAMNPAAGTMFNQPDLTGKTVRECFPIEDEECYDAYDRVLETGEPMRFERESMS